MPAIVASVSGTGTAARYGRSAEIASKMSAAVMIRVSSVIASALRPRG